MLISSHLFAHHARLREQPGLARLAYVHTPARYIWEPSVDRRGASPLARMAAAALKPFDRARAQELTSVAANSDYTRERIERVWGISARVIHPPVDVERIQGTDDWAQQVAPTEADVLAKLPEVFVLGASRFVPYKRLEAVIDAGDAAGLPVVIAGGGADEANLRAHASRASVPVTFVLKPTDEMLFALYQRALVLIFPAIEDFGIMPVEAMAAGTPVVVSSQGGAAESARLLAGGVSADCESPGDWRHAIDLASAIDGKSLARRTRLLSRQSFRASIEGWVRDYA